jgi:hypothetical protein
MGWEINLKLIFRLPEHQQNSYWRGFDFCFDFNPWCAIDNGVDEKHDFRGIQQKIPQNSNFAQKQD